MSLRSRSKLVTVVAAAVLPPLFLTVCLVFRAVEGWNLWHEFIGLTPLVVVVWSWVLAYIFASVVTIFELDDQQHLAWWEFLINASNTVTSLALALECAGELTDLMGGVSFIVRTVVLFVLCLMAQGAVTLATWRGRAIARRLHQELQAHHVDSDDAPVTALRVRSSRVRIGRQNDDW